MAYILKAFNYIVRIRSSIDKYFQKIFLQDFCNFHQRLIDSYFTFGQQQVFREELSKTVESGLGQMEGDS